MISEGEQLEENKKLFVKVLIDQCTRTLSTQKMQAALPAPLHPLIPNTDISPHCIFFETSSTTVSSVEISLSKAGSSIASDNCKAEALFSVFSTKDGVLIASETIQAALKPLAQEILQMIIDRDEVEELESWMETDRDVDSIVEASGWRAGLLLQAIVMEGKQSVSATMSLFVMYESILRNLTVTREDQLVMLSALIECLGTESHTLSIILDGMIRKGILNAGHVVTWAYSSTNLSKIAIDPWISIYADIVADRSLELVTAAFLRRQNLLAESDMDVETNAPTDVSGGAVEIIEKGKHAYGESSVGESVDEGTEEIVDFEADIAQPVVDEAQLRADKLANIEEALKASVESCRSTYTIAVGNLLSACCSRHALLEANGVDDGFFHLDPEYLGMTSILKRLLRVFHGTESELRRCSACNENADMSLKLTNLEEELKNIVGVTTVPEPLNSLIQSYL